MDSTSSTRAAKSIRTAAEHASSESETILELPVVLGTGFAIITRGTRTVASFESYWEARSFGDAILAIRASNRDLGEATGSDKTRKPAIGANQ
jgi:hypothetical protein